MRENTKKVLTWLYPTDSVKTGRRQVRLVTESELKMVLPDLSEAGWKSMIYLLIKEGLIAREALIQGVRGGKTGGKEKERALERGKIRLTDWGINEIEREMPVLQRNNENWDGSWNIVILGDSPRHDLEFKTLRKTLKANKALMLTRGVYVHPNLVENELKNNLKKYFGKYLGCVWILAKADFAFGDLRKTIFEKNNLNELDKAYSGISRELSSLLGNIKSKKMSIQRSNFELVRIFDRLFYVGLEDGGLMSLMYHSDILNFGKYIGFSTLLGELQRELK